MRVAFDGTPLLGQRTGVGMVTAAVAEAVAARGDVELTAFAMTWNGRHDIAAALPAGVRLGGRPLPAAPLLKLWSVLDVKVPGLTGPADVVHGTNFVVPPSGRRTGEVVTVHDLTAELFPALCTPTTLRYPTLIRRAIKRGAFVITPSQAVADEVVDHLGANPEQVTAVHHGLTPDVVGGDAAAGRKLAGSDRYLLAVGTVEPRKGLPSLVRAFTLVGGDDPDLRLVIAGPDGWGADALTNAIAASPVPDRIVRLGYVGGEDRRDLLAGATVYVYPSIYEGFGLPPLEALAAGVPVVASTAGALVEVLGAAAVLAQAGDVEALAQAIVDLLGDEPRRRRLAANGPAHASQFTWTKAAAEIVDVYRRAAAGWWRVKVRG